MQQTGKMLELAKATRIADLNLSKALEAVKALRDEGFGAETVNSYIRAVKGFVRWLWRDGRAREHALVHLATTKGDLRHPRRALTPDEAGRVVLAAEAGEEHRGLSARDRAMLYRVALGTGYRASELRSLVPERFNLEADPPTITCKACYTKNKKQAVQPIAQSLADLLRPWLARKPRGKAVFERLPHEAADMLKIDLEAAGIPYETDSGVVDFHALRAAYISHLVSSGVSVKTCQTLARHANPSLTIGIYAKASLHDISGAVEGLPDLTSTQPATEKQVMAATGTDPVQNCYFRSEDTENETTQVQSPQNVAGVLGVYCGDDALSLESCEHMSRRDATPCDDNRTNPLFSSVKRASADQSSDHDASRRIASRSPSATSGATLIPADRGLALVIDAWDRLSEATRADIVAMVKASKGDNHGD